MRKLFVGIGLLSMVSVAHAQVVNPQPEDPGTDCKAYYGAIGGWFKVNNPSIAGDWFNVDYDTTAASCTVTGICIEIWDTLAVPEIMPALGVYPESTAFPNTPDTTSAIAAVGAAVASTDGFGDLVYYPLPCVHLGSTDVHVAGNWNSGDSTSWVGADTAGPINNRSFATSTGYAAGAGGIGLNWVAGLQVVPAGGTKGTLLVNGSTSATVSVYSTMCLTVWLAQPGLSFILYFCPSGIPFLQLLPVAFTVTNSPFFPAACDNGWQVCIAAECGFVTGGIPIEFCVIYQDPCNPKANGKPSLQLSPPAGVTVTDAGNACNGCYGVRDDGSHEGFFWKITNPSGSSDWFNVNFGTASASTAAGAGGTSITSVEMGYSDNCGVANSWVSVGEHPANFTLDPTGATPDLNAGSAVAPAATVAGQTHTGVYPGSVYDIPDIAINTTDIYHAAVGWNSGDTCLWIASDSDGTDPNSGCGSPFPNSFSGLTQDGYTNAASAATVANWAIKINWL
jgi:hypothetical protein